MNLNDEETLQVEVKKSWLWPRVGLRLVMLLVALAASIFAVIGQQEEREVETIHDLILRRDVKRVEHIAHTSPSQIRETEHLHLAIATNDPSMVRALLIAKPDVNGHNSSGYTPLSFLAQQRPSASNAKEIAKILLDAGADPNLSNLRFHSDSHENKWITDGPKPLHYAVREISHSTSGYENTKNLDLIKILVSGGADINARDHMGRTPMHYLCSYTPILKQNEYQFVQAVDYLLANDADPHVTDTENKTPLQCMCETNINLALLSRIIDLETQINEPINENGETILHAAVANAIQRHQRLPFWEYQTTIIGSLLDHGADPTIRSKDGRRPFDASIELEAAEVKALIDAISPRPQLQPFYTEGNSP